MKRLIIGLLLVGVGCGVFINHEVSKGSVYTPVSDSKDVEQVLEVQSEVETSPVVEPVTEPINTLGRDARPAINQPSTSVDPEPQPTKQPINPVIKQQPIEGSLNE